MAIQPSGPISKWFQWHEALYLPQWDREATEEDGLTTDVKKNLINLFSKMDQIRDHFGKPVIVHVTFRPGTYNQLVKGAANSAHMYGMACDFHVEGMNCDDVRADIISNGLLDSLGMRMERNPGSSWVHLDIRQPAPGHDRYFQP